MSADLSSGGGPPGEVPVPAPSVVPSFGDWLRVNLAIGTLSFGSASRIVLYEDAVVRDRGWLTADEFSEVLTVAQLLPGPNLVNLSAYLGYRLVGVAGALVGIVCLCLPGAVPATSLFLPTVRGSIARTFIRIPLHFAANRPQRSQSSTPIING